MKQRIVSASVLVCFELGLGTVAQAVGTSYSSAKAGDWTNTATWSPSTGCPTNADDTATIAHKVTLISLLPSITSIAINSGGTNVLTTVSQANPNTVTNNGGELCIDGAFSNAWNVTLNNGAMLRTKLGCFLDGTITIGDNATVNISHENNYANATWRNGVIKGPSTSTVNMSYKNSGGSYREVVFYKDNPDWFCNVNLDIPINITPDTTVHNANVLGVAQGDAVVAALGTTRPPAAWRSL